MGCFIRVDQSRFSDLSSTTLVKAALLTAEIGRKSSNVDSRLLNSKNKDLNNAVESKTIAVLLPQCSRSHKEVYSFSFPEREEPALIGPKRKNKLPWSNCILELEERNGS